MGTKPKITPRNKQFIKALVKGNNMQDSAKMAGYSPSYATQLLKKTLITKALEEAGLTDKAIAEGIKTNINAGMGIKATASDSLKGLDLVTRLKGYQDKSTPDTQHNTQVNVYSGMSDDDLKAKLDELQGSIDV